MTGSAGVAAACVAAGVPLSTRDAHFAHLPALRVVSW
jgi:predicted nucleic acid-binding protein